MKENRTEEWKIGVLVAAGLILFLAEPMCKILVPSAYTDNAKQEDIARVWDVYIFLMHLIPLLLLKVSRTVFTQNYFYLLVVDIIMAVLVGDLLVRIIYGETVRTWTDPLGLIIASVLWVIKHHKTLVKWFHAMRKFYKKYGS